MGIEVEGAKLALEVVSTAALAVVSWFTLRIKGLVSEIKLDQAKNKAEMVDVTNKTKEELTAHNAAMRTELSVHTAVDDERFSGIDKTLERIEEKIDRNYNSRVSEGHRDPPAPRRP